MTIALQPLEIAWGKLHTLIPVFPIRTPQQYERAIETLNHLLETVGENEKHPLYDLLDTLGTLIRAYEENYCPRTEINGVDILKYLMNEQKITVNDLPELGNKAYITDLLTGKKQLTLSDAKALAQRFNLSVATFV